MNTEKVLMPIVLSVLMFVWGCGPTAQSNGEDETEATQGTSETPAQLDAALQTMVTCDSGFHAHYIDWSSTVMSTDGACGGGRTLYYGTHFCEKNSQIPVWCGNLFAYEVFGYLYSDHNQYGYVKQCALDGHC